MILQWFKTRIDKVHRRYLRWQFERRFPRVKMRRQMREAGFVRRAR